VRAARWDVDAEIGGTWTVTVKRLAEGEALPLVAPCTLQLWAVDADPVGATPVKTVTGTLAGDSKAATFTLTANEISTLGRGAHEHVLTLTDPAAGAQVMARGVFIVRGRVSDL
jgi:hypothetical protein